MSFGACGAFAPLAGLSPAPAAYAAGRVKSRRPDWASIKPRSQFDCEVLSSISPARRWGADSLRVIDLQRSPFFEKRSDYLQLLGGAG